MNTIKNIAEKSATEMKNTNKEINNKNNAFSGLTHKLNIALFTIVIAFAGIMSEAKAGCPGIPDCWEQFEGPFEMTIEYPVGSGCYVTFEYCWRNACGGGSNGGYNDCYISNISTTCDPGDFDVDYYKNLATVCLSALVTTNPWDVSGGFAGIPPCPNSSQIYWRLGHPSCTSDWYTSTRIIQMPGGDHITVIVEKPRLVIQVEICLLFVGTQ